MKKGSQLAGAVPSKEEILKKEEERKKAAEDEAKLAKELDYGKTTPVRGDLNPQTRSILEAEKGAKYPERLSPLIPPKPFDKEAYKKNPEAYLNVVEPGRVFQSLQPGEGVPRLHMVSPSYQEVVQGKSVKLRVKALAGYPVSFTSFDLGHFQNQLTSLTVEAGEDGIAEAEFFGAPGTINEVKILASSPVTSGQVKFLVNVLKP